MAATVVDNVITLDASGETTSQILGRGTTVDAILIVRSAVGDLACVVNNAAGTALMTVNVLALQSTVIPRAKYTGGLGWATTNSVIYVILQ